MGSGVAQHLRERRAPHPGTHDRRFHAGVAFLGSSPPWASGAGPGSASGSAGLPVRIVLHLSARRLPGGPAGDGGIVGGAGGVAAPQLGQQAGDVGHDRGGGGPQHVPAQRLALRRRTGRPAGRPASAPCAWAAGAGFLVPYGRISCAPQVGERDHRDARGQRHPGDAGLGHHRPLGRVAGGGALRVDDHAFALGKRAFRLLEDQRGVGGAPVDRKLAGRVQEWPDHFDVERRGLDEEGGVAARLVDEQGHRGPVSVGEMVAGHDHPARAGDVLMPVPVAFHRGRISGGKVTWWRGARPESRSGSHACSSARPPDASSGQSPGSRAVVSRQDHGMTAQPADSPLTWSLVVPVKVLARAKSRLAAAGRAAPARARACDGRGHRGRRAGLRGRGQSDRGDRRPAGRARCWPASARW